MLVPAVLVMRRETGRAVNGVRAHELPLAEAARDGDLECRLRREPRLDRAPGGGSGGDLRGRLLVGERPEHARELLAARAAPGTLGEVRLGARSLLAIEKESLVAPESLRREAAHDSPFLRASSMETRSSSAAASLVWAVRSEQPTWAATSACVRPCR